MYRRYGYGMFRQIPTGAAIAIVLGVLALPFTIRFALTATEKEFTIAVVIIAALAILAFFAAVILFAVWITAHITVEIKTSTAREKSEEVMPPPVMRGGIDALLADVTSSDVLEL